MFFYRSLGDSSKEQRLSPKKQMQVASKSGQTRKLGSPNAKKVTNCRSPNTKKTTSPQQHVSIENLPNPDASNAIQTARKLKKMFESGSNADADEVTKATNDNAKRCNVKRNQTTKPIIKKQKRGHDEMPSIDANEAGPSSYEQEQRVDDRAIAMEASGALPASSAEPTIKPSHKNESKADTNKTPEKIPWSRDEDRVLLEVIKKGMEMSMEDISEIANQFPNKTAEHIRARVDFLIDFLTNL